MKSSIFKQIIISFFIFSALLVTPIAYAQDGAPISEIPNYLDCGHCDPNWMPDLEGCSPKTGCVVDIDTQLKYLPYYGIPEIAASLPASYWAGFGSLLVLLFLAIFLKR